MTIPNTVSEFSQLAAKEFLQTVVFIDDRIYGRKDGSVSEPKQASMPKGRPHALKSADQKISSEVNVNIEESDQEEYSPREIVTSFAKKQIICSLYQPERTAKFSGKSDVFSLCLAADIVIVDWDLYGDAGKKALELVDELIQRAVTDVPEQLRLILIYTDQINLFDIGDQLYEKIRRNIGDKDLSVEDKGLAFHTLNSRISILGKENRKRSEEYKNHEVPEKKLADKAIEEFAKLASGLLHAATLLGLAEIKKNSRKILSKFNSSLDPAFLTHRAMSLGSDDASAHIIPLLVSEIEAVLEDALSSPLITEQLITDWCMNVWEPGSPANDLLPGQNPTDIRNIATDFCLKGEKAKEKNNQILKLNSNQSVRKFSKLLLTSEDAISNHEFSHLMTSRTFYGNAPKTLKLGSVIHDVESDRYLLCIQPVCDSVRLDDKRTFIFVHLTNTNQSPGNYASHVVIKENGEAIELYYQPKSFKCYTAEFLPDTDTKQVQTCKSETHFVDTNGKKYVWLDQLKTSHAQRAVERYARELSRVGLMESEWLRRLDK